MVNLDFSWQKTISRSLKRRKEEKGKRTTWFLRVQPIKKMHNFKNL